MEKCSRENRNIGIGDLEVGWGKRASERKFCNENLKHSAHYSNWGKLRSFLHFP